MAKRSNGEGTLSKRKDGRWEARLMVGFRENGRPRIQCFYGKTQKEVKEKVRIFRETQKSELQMGSSYTFSQWADLWYEHHKSRIAPTTQENYQYTLQILKNHIGSRILSEIKPFDIELLLKAIQGEGRSDSYLSKCRALAFQIFEKAEANDLIRKNPVRYAEKLRSREPVKRKEAFTAEEIRILMEKLPVDRIGLSIRLLLGTGMRTQELLALEPRHIAADGSVIQVRQAINMVKGTATIGRPKSRDSYRDIPVPANVRWCAVRLRSTSAKYIWESPKKPGMPCNPSHFRAQFRNALEGVGGVRMLTPHSCRHTYVSQLQALGVDLPTIQSIVGHADIDMTQHYLHVQDSVRQDAINRFANAFQTVENTLD